ncbi:hypothetical protein EV356DRAFT_518197 [Viridothelium virens]|uniref:Fungal N-terminal domain-containing protein n=1 Tax=Viridothelium virens TaxID=1048519 RepID=A0A6A6H1R2_VIRVR|nr:hypothetical protein EV356DRAFT_518197 [Viridothelium virens]
MEAAGTIVGVLSLGITVCDGVIHYCRSWKNQDDEIRALIALTVGLKQLLKDLDDRLLANLPHNLRFLEHVNSSIQDCDRNINSILQLSEKYTVGRISGLRGKAKDIAYKLKFPFEKKAFDELREFMVAFRGNVNTALQFLSMHISGNIQNADAQITRSIAQELAQGLPALGDSMKSSLARRIDESTVSIDNVVSQSSVAIRDDNQSFLVLHRQQIDALQEQKLQLNSLAQSLA